MHSYDSLMTRSYNYELCAHCNTLQHTATHCHTLQHTANWSAHLLCEMCWWRHCLPCVAVCCSVLQCVAVCCRAHTTTDTQICADGETVCINCVLSWSFPRMNPTETGRFPTVAATLYIHCIALQFTASHCNPLHTATHCNRLHVRIMCWQSSWETVCCSVLQCVAVCCSVLQCVRVCCSTSSGEQRLFKR